MTRIKMREASRDTGSGNGVTTLSTKAQASSDIYSYDEARLFSRRR